MWRVLVAACYFMVGGWGREGRWGQAEAKWPQSQKQPGLPARARASPQLAQLFGKKITGPETPAWLLHSPQLLPNRHRERNVFKTKETNGDREGRLCAAEIKRHDGTIKDIYRRNLSPITCWRTVCEEELFYIIKDKNQVYR